jgi:hypothetical protein
MWRRRTIPHSCREEKKVISRSKFRLDFQFIIVLHDINGQCKAGSEQLILKLDNMTILVVWSFEDSGVVCYKI